MRHFPIFMDLQGSRTLVLGTGPVADRKADALAQAGAIVQVATRYERQLLIGCMLAVGADATEPDLVALADDARRKGIPVNIVDRPDLSSFIMPAIIDRDPLTIAVSSGGTAPVLARLLRAKIEALVPPAYGRLATIAQEFKASLRRRFPDIAQRRRLLERLLGGRAADLVFSGQDEAARTLFAEAIETADVPRNGMVFLVGAGPGAADLLTIRAQRLLGEADVIVHDRLVTDAVLEMARRDAERIFVGKARAKHCMPQADINALMIRLARNGRKVVRLKGGDPLVFGRGGEEAEALAAAGINFEIVPGVTAALACAAQARIPLTHREAARGVTFVTGHTKDGVADLDFAALARSRDTLAIYMGIAALPTLAAGLLAHGMDASLPTALIERGGTAQQRELRGTFQDVAARAHAWSTGGPTLILLGAAVARSVPPLETSPARESARDIACAD